MQEIHVLSTLRWMSVTERKAECRFTLSSSPGAVSAGPGCHDRLVRSTILISDAITPAAVSGERSQSAIASSAAAADRSGRAARHRAMICGRVTAARAPAAVKTTPCDSHRPRRRRRRGTAFFRAGMPPPGTAREKHCLRRRQMPAVRRSAARPSSVRRPRDTAARPPCKVD